jgi:hypothetical protein
MPEPYPPEFDLDGDLTGCEMLDTLDAYGHLTWTVGNDDWIACADYNVFINTDGEVIFAYHVVVDCESGGFTDTVEAQVRNLTKRPFRSERGWCPLWQYADICSEHYMNDAQFGTPDHKEVEAACRSFEESVLISVAKAQKLIDDGGEIPQGPIDE